MGDNDDKNKWAILIGIDRYPDFKDTLGAEENQDLIPIPRLMAEEDQDLLADMLRNMLDHAKYGDVVLFHHSGGHGMGAGNRSTRGPSGVWWDPALGAAPKSLRGPLDVDRLYRLLQDKATSDFTLIIDRCEGDGDLILAAPEADANHGGGVGSKKGASRGARLLDLLKAIDELDASIRENPVFSEDQKADIAGDLLTIQAQVAKRNPIADIVMMAWVSFKSMAGPAEVGKTARKVEYLLQRFL